MSKKEPLKISDNAGNKKIFFGDDGEIIDKPLEKQKEKQNKKVKNHMKNGIDTNVNTKWYQKYDGYNSKEVTEIKDSEFKSFEEHCKKCFDEEVEKLGKNNPSDAKWLQTALHKGTSKDRANAGALLVQSNPIPNLSALDSLITLTKFSNKNSADILETVTNLFKNLLPSHRKLISLDHRANDWKNLKKSTLEVATRNQIYALWYFENELKGRYNSFLQNLQGSLQNGKEINKIKAIISASNLLKSCPEREAFLLTIIVNKFGDPDKKIASKATYNLRQILLTHPNMAHVMVLETEKLIFRKNINDLAQHYGIGFLSLIAPIANVQSSQKLINICFCFFKIKIEKGDINSKTMQAILNCLRIAIQNINDFNEENKKVEITTPDVVNTIYRLIYLSNISISFQALSLLLQLVLVQNENHDRFYNALYRKMIDPEIFIASSKITSLYFHIVHRSIYQDTNVNRCKAFIKRLLQMTLSFSPSKACGALIVISKLLKSRPELKQFYLKKVVKDETEEMKVNEKLASMEDDSEDEHYKDVEIDGKKNSNEASKASSSSWIHVKNTAKQKEETTSQIKVPTAYDPFKRSAAYCGAEFTLYYEIIQMSKYFHPTVQVFVQNIMKSQNINYYGDPLKDFSLSHFLERFAFKNPKKVNEKDEKSAFKHHTYQAKGSRGQSVHSLTDQTCTEDERFIFDFIQRKREIREKNIKLSEENDEENVSDVESVDDDEFDSYLDTLGAKADFDKSEEDFDYLSELKNESSKKDSKGSKKKKSTDVAEESEDDNWDDDSMDGSDLDEDEMDDFENESGTDESIDEMDMSGNDDMDESGDDDFDETPMKSSKKLAKKSKKDEKGMNNLFVSVDDFSEMIEKNSSKHGTLGEIFNKDKSSQKQLDWEEKRHNRPSGFKRKKSFGNGKKFPLKNKKFKK